MEKKNFNNLLEIVGGDGKGSILINKYKKKVDLIELKNSYWLKKLQEKKIFNKIIIENFIKKN